MSETITIHPCKKTCSGYQAGMDEGVKSFLPMLKKINKALSSPIGMDTKKIKDALNIVNALILELQGDDD